MNKMVNTKVSYSVSLEQDKDKIKFIKKTEKVIRTSLEYKDFIQFLKSNWDFTKDIFWRNVDSEISKKIHIEVHHTPLTLFDITSIMLEKMMKTDEINQLLLSEQVMKLHYMNLVGLAPLSKTIHETIHARDDIMVPLTLTSGNWLEFLKIYEEYLPDNVKEKIDAYEEFTDKFTIDTFDIFKFNPIVYDNEIPKNIEYRHNEDSY